MWIMISKDLYGLCLIFTFVSWVAIVNSENLLCDQEEAVFEVVNKGVPVEEDVISSHAVTSWFECGNKCLENQECIAFSHLDEHSDRGINCKLAKNTGDIVVVRGNDAWTTYGIRSNGLDICLQEHRCLNGGRCVRNACDPNGYLCMCNTSYWGTHCENGTISDSNNFDVVFKSQEPELSYIEMDNQFTSDLAEFTFSTWFKISQGLYKYHLLSHRKNGITDDLAIYFKTVDEQGTVNLPVQRIYVHHLQDRLNPRPTPVNDGIWHHLGVVWDNKNGRFDVLMDGIPMYMQENIKKDALMPGGGTFLIGQYYTVSGFEADSGFLGEISAMNIWNRSLSGEMIESMAKSEVHLEGNVLKWSEVPMHIFGDVEVVRPAKIKNYANEGVDFELRFENSVDANYVSPPSPNKPFTDLSICLWIKTFKPATFVSYSVDGQTSPLISFGIDANYELFLNIGRSTYTSNVSDASIVNNHWQHMCVTVKQRKHKILFSRNDMQIQLRLNVDISFPKEGKFEIGAQKIGDSYVQLFVGTVTYLNIWSVAIPESCVRTMAGGVMNVKGDLLAWCNVPEYIVGNLIMVPNTNIYNPGYSLLDKRSKWCDQNVLASCGPLYARIGRNIEGTDMAWRCYCAEALYVSKLTYKPSTASTAYETRHDEIVAVV